MFRKYSMKSKLVPQKTSSQPRANSAFKQLWSMHTVIASCYLLVLVGGFWMVKMPDNTPLQGNAYSLHKSIGALTMALLT
jgi:cytochrome b561